MKQGAPYFLNTNSKLRNEIMSRLPYISISGTDQQKNNFSIQEINNKTVITLKKQTMKTDFSENFIFLMPSLSENKT